MIFLDENDNYFTFRATDIRKLSFHPVSAFISSQFIEEIDPKWFKLSD